MSDEKRKRPSRVGAPRKHKPDKATKRPVDARALKVEADAMALRVRGASYTQIAERLGLTKAGAYDAVHRSIEKHRAAVKEDVAEAVAIEVERLDALHAIAYAQALSGNHGAIDRVLALASRRAKLLGLDAPTRQEIDAVVQTTDARPALAARLAALSGAAGARGPAGDTE